MRIKYCISQAFHLDFGGSFHTHTIANNCNPTESVYRIACSEEPSEAAHVPETVKSQQHRVQHEFIPSTSVITVQSTLHYHC